MNAHPRMNDHSSFSTKRAYGFNWTNSRQNGLTARDACGRHVADTGSKENNPRAQARFKFYGSYFSEII